MKLPLRAHQIVDVLPWPVSSRIAHFFPPTVAYYYIVSAAPLIILIPEDFYDAEKIWRPFFEALKNTKVHFLCLVRGPVEASPADYAVQRIYAEHRARYPKHSLTYLANNSIQHTLFEERGIPAIFFNQNAIADERSFTVMEGTTKVYDAIYNAGLAPVKRHYLAARIDNLALVTIVNHKTCPSYFRHIALTLPNASWLNFDGNVPDMGRYKMFAAKDVTRSLNQAHVGLCLSKHEGAMFASIEYLLCGLAVLTTQSFGGRDVFFDDEYVQYVDDSPESVRQGLENLLARQPGSQYIREKTLRKMEEHRNRLVEWVQRVYASENKHVDPREVRRNLFPNQIYKLRKMHEVLAFI